MCSRFALKSPSQALASLFKMEKAVEWKPRYNVAPSQNIPAVIRPLENKQREMRLFQWGLVASWAQGCRILVNVRSEEIGQKPLLRESFEKWRCLIPVDGFYEWRREGRETQPYFFRMKRRRPFALAGLWSKQVLGGKAVETCAILTTSPNEVVSPVHHRMPVVVEEKDFDLWLDSEDVRDFDQVKNLFKPMPAFKMESFPVGSWVNNAYNDDPRCMEPAPVKGTLSLPFEDFPPPGPKRPRLYSLMV